MIAFGTGETGALATATGALGTAETGILDKIVGVFDTGTGALGKTVGSRGILSIILALCGLGLGLRAR